MRITKRELKKLIQEEAKLVLESNSNSIAKFKQDVDNLYKVYNEIQNDIQNIFYIVKETDGTVTDANLYDPGNAWDAFSANGYVVTTTIEFEDEDQLEKAYRKLNKLYNVRKEDDNTLTIYIEY